MVLDNISRATSIWRNLVSSPTELRSAYQGSEELYYALREIRISLGKHTLTADDVRTAMMTLASLSPLLPTTNPDFPRTMFSDLRVVWASSWTTSDYTAIFDILKWKGTFDDSLSLIKYIHEQQILKFIRTVIVGLCF
jgi:hypothetical protein